MFNNIIAINTMDLHDSTGTQLLLPILKTNPESTENLLNLNIDKDGCSGLFGINDSMRKRSRTYSNWSPSEEGVTLAWSDLTVYAQTKTNGKIRSKRIINGVTGAVKAGSLVALMGASGAGKTTLMSTLAHRNAAGVNIEGDILINGRPIGDYMKHLSGFMHQDDIFIGSLTVWEHMNIMAHLKLDRRVSTTERTWKIHELLRNMGLMKCLDTRIGGDDGSAKTLSGGEKKRLAFATELLTDPPLLFCDEPTTGLDAWSARNIISIMNQMAAGGKTILCTIHQPSSDVFAMFGQVILVAEGRIAYMGCAASAIDFFNELDYNCPSSYNPADYFIETLAVTPGHEECGRKTIKRICDQFSFSDYFKEVEIVVLYEFHMGRAVLDKTYTIRANFKEHFWWTKLCWLIRRWFIDILRNPPIQTVRILQKIAISAIIGFCYFGTDNTTQSGIQSIQGVAFVFVSENTFPPMYSVLDEFPHNYPLFLREYKSGLYSPAIYYLSRIIAMLPGLILEPVIFVIIAYWLAGLRSTVYAFLMTVFTSVLTMNVSIACGVFFSNAFDSVPTAMAYLVPFDNMLMITAGLFIKLNTLPYLFSWAKYLSWLMYSMESISIIQWAGVSNITCDGDPNEDLPCLTDGSQVLEKYSFSETNLLLDLCGMTMLCVVFYLLGFLCLWLNTRRNK